MQTNPAPTLASRPVLITVAAGCVAFEPLRVLAGLGWRLRGRVGAASERVGRAASPRTRARRAGII